MTENEKQTENSINNMTDEEIEKLNDDKLWGYFGDPRIAEVCHPSIGGCNVDQNLK